MAVLTEEEFTRHINTQFDVMFGEERLRLRLGEVKPYLPQPNEQTGMKRFSVYFQGSGDRYLPQGLYQLIHEEMGEFELFLVPIEKNENGFRYEAVFNYYQGPVTSDK